MSDDHEYDSADLHDSLNNLDDVLDKLSPEQQLKAHACLLKSILRRLRSIGIETRMLLPMLRAKIRAAKNAGVLNTKERRFAQIDKRMEQIRALLTDESEFWNASLKEESERAEE